jgi:hypothetical protein
MFKKAEVPFIEINDAFNFIADITIFYLQLLRVKKAKEREKKERKEKREWKRNKERKSD